MPFRTVPRRVVKRQTRPAPVRKAPPVKKQATRPQVPAERYTRPCCGR